MNEIKKEERSIKIDIKKRRKSMMNKRNSIQMSEYQDNKKTKDSDHSKRKSLMLGSIADLKLNTKKELNEDKTTITNKKMRARKSVMVNPLIGLSSFVKLKGQLTDISELIVQQEPDISEAICGCQQPNNYHIYTRERNGTLSYILSISCFISLYIKSFCFSPSATSFISLSIPALK